MLYENLLLLMHRKKNADQLIGKQMLKDVPCPSSLATFISPL